MPPKKKKPRRRVRVSEGPNVVDLDPKKTFGDGVIVQGWKGMRDGEPYLDVRMPPVGEALVRGNVKALLAFLREHEKELVKRVKGV